jgi:RNA polymerase sigma factor (sigma-70 family)
MCREADLLQQNQGLVWRFTAKHRAAYPNLSDDLIAAATVGLLQAIRVHDPAKGALSTIAFRYVIREVSDLIESFSATCVPAGQRDKTLRIQRKIASGKSLRAAAKAEGLTVTEAEMLIAVGMHPVSANTPANSRDEPDELLDTFVAETPTPEEAAVKADLCARIWAAIGNLPDKPRFAVCMRFGFTDATPADGFMTTRPTM